MFEYREEATGRVDAPAAQVFELLDDPARLAAHMKRRSWTMGWGTMETTLDAANGRAVGSRISMRGRVFGILLRLEEVVTSRDPGVAKTWETIGEPRLLVIGRYRMGFDVRGERAATVRVWIEYDLPTAFFANLLGRLLGRSYARWCTRRVLAEAARAAGGPTEGHR